MTRERLRLAYALHGSPPRECADHAADYAARLARLEPSTAAHILRDSRGRMWQVTKLSDLLYLMSGPRVVEARSASEAGREMEDEHA